MMSAMVILILVFVCLLSFLAGAGVALGVRVTIGGRINNDIPEENEELREQWIKLLNYDGRQREED